MGEAREGGVPEQVSRAQPEQVPRAQGFFDNVFLLLALGILIPTISYTLWGLIEIAMVPQLPLP